MRVIRRDPVIFNLEIPEIYSYSREQVRFLSRLYSFSKDVSSQNSNYEYHFAFLIRAALRDYRFVENLWQNASRNRAVVVVEDLAERVFNELFVRNPQEARRSLEIMDYAIDDIAKMNLTYKETILKYIEGNIMGTKNVLSPDNFFRVLRSLRNRPEISDQLPSMHRTILCDILPLPEESEPKWSLFWVTFGNYFNRAVYKNKNYVFFWKSLAFSALTDFAKHFPQEQFTIFGGTARGSDDALLVELGHTVTDEFRETPGLPPIDNFKQAATCGHIPTLVHILKSREGQVLHQNRADLCLFHSINNGNVETTEFLLRSGLKFSDPQVKTIFDIAGSMGYIKFLAFTLKKESIGVQPRRPKEVFLEAIRNGNIDVIDSVISVAVRGALTFSEPVLESAIVEAIYSRNVRIVAHLCHSELKFSQKTMDKALSVANELRNPEMIQYLLTQSGWTFNTNNSTENDIEDL